MALKFLEDTIYSFIDFLRNSSGQFVVGGEQNFKKGGGVLGDFGE